MIQDISLPEELSIALGSESKDFAVKGGRSQPVGKSMSSIIFGIVWLSFTLFFASFITGPIFQPHLIKTISEFISTPDTQGAKNGPLFVVIMLGVFLIIGIYVILTGIIPLFKKGGYFVATPTRLVNFKKGQLFSSDWEQFTGNITVHGTNKRGSITLEMRTGYMVSSKSGSRYVPNEIYISGISNAYEIEQICRKRIKENDPTPPVI